MKHLMEQDISTERARRSCGIPSGRAQRLVFLFFVLAMILNGSALHRSAQRRTFGTVRTLWVTATRPLDVAARQSRLGSVREHVERWFHSGE